MKKLILLLCILSFTDIAAQIAKGVQPVVNTASAAGNESFKAGSNHPEGIVNNASLAPLKIIRFYGNEHPNNHELNWQVENEQPGDLYILERRRSINEPFFEVFRAMATNQNPTNIYKAKVPNIASGEVFYRLTTKAKTGEIAHSTPTTIGNRSDQFKAFVSGNNLYIKLPNDARSVSLFNAAGELLSKQMVTAANGLTSFGLDRLPHGMIVVWVYTLRGTLTTKVVY